MSKNFRTLLPYIFFCKSFLGKRKRSSKHRLENILFLREWYSLSLKFSYTIKLKKENILLYRCSGNTNKPWESCITEEMKQHIIDYVVKVGGKQLELEEQAKQEKIEKEKSLVDKCFKNIKNEK